MTDGEGKGTIAHHWRPIANLDADWQRLCREDLHILRDRWTDLRARPEVADHARRHKERLMTLQAIETGLIERLYRVTPEVTNALADAGVEAIQHLEGDDRIGSQAAALIKDQRTALEMALDIACGDRVLTGSYIRELHRGLTENQDTRDALDMQGRRFVVALSKGEWKRLPNNPVRLDGRSHEYCPPDFVQDEIDQLVEWHANHTAAGVCAEVEGAWLHHRFGQIHPFEDGNGRVARCLTAAVFMRGGYPPPVVRDREHRDAYMDTLEVADRGELGPLVNLFSDIEAADLAVAIRDIERGYDANDGERTTGTEGGRDAPT